jgi:hypothetical protein
MNGITLSRISSDSLLNSTRQPQGSDLYGKYGRLRSRESRISFGNSRNQRCPEDSAYDLKEFI